jgi:hypothetical protein
MMKAHVDVSFLTLMGDVYWFVTNDLRNIPREGLQGFVVIIELFEIVSVQSLVQYGLRHCATDEQSL